MALDQLEQLTHQQNSLINFNILKKEGKMPIRGILDKVILVLALLVLVIVVVGKWTTFEIQQPTFIMAFSAFEFEMPELLFPFMVIGPIAIIVILFLPRVSSLLCARLIALFGVLQVMSLVWLLLEVQIRLGPKDTDFSRFSYLRFWFWLHLGIGIALTLTTIAKFMIKNGDPRKQASDSD